MPQSPPFRLAALALLAAAPLPAQAPLQAPLVLRGRVVKAADGGPVAGAHVFATGTGRASTTTAAAGLFHLTLPRGATHVVAVRIGFAPETLAVSGTDGAVVVRLRPAPLLLTPAVVRAERSLSAASSGAIREFDVRLRPRESSQELLRLAPGLAIAQHAGGGKAEQLFLRGFDADHGTDVAVSVDGMPVNMVTHAHGQGYADLHFLMPEVVEGADVRKGPYDLRDGDFATAGAVAFRTRDRVDAPVAAVRGGSFGTRHAVGMVPLGGDATRAGGYLAASAHRADGPFDAPQNYRRLNLFGKWTTPVSVGAELVAAASAFDSRWDASGQIPERAVRAGLVRRFGALDPSEGGATSRVDLSAALRSRAAGAADWEARVYTTRYHFLLNSNFTYFLSDSVNGDGIEQTDRRTTVGATGTYARPGALLGRAGRWSVAAGVRGDAGNVALYHQRARRRLAAHADARNVQAHVYQWAGYAAQVGDRVRFDVGTRGDVFRFDVTDCLLDRPSTACAAAVPSARAVRWRGIVSPKANVAVDVTPTTTLFANAGAGFHSNDGRDVVAARRGDRVLPRATGAELGARHTWTGGSVAAALWGLDLQSELVYVGDEGVTESSGRTRRVGVDVEFRARLAPWLWGDADFNVARGRFRDEPAASNRVPLAPTVTATGGVTVRDLGPVDGGLRVRHIGPRAATEDNAVVARGSTVWELFGGWRLAHARAFFAVDNLFGVEWNEAQFATTSRLRGEPAPVTELHFTPGAPRSVQVGIEYQF